MKKINEQKIKKIFNINSLEKLNKNFVNFLTKKIKILEEFNCDADIEQYIVMMIQIWNSNKKEKII